MSNQNGFGIGPMIGIAIIVIGPFMIRSCNNARMAPQLPQGLIQPGNEYPCDLATGVDSLGRRCGGRAAEVIPGGRLGGTGLYQDSQGNLRQIGECNDMFDDPDRCVP